MTTCLTNRELPWKWSNQSNGNSANGPCLLRPFFTWNDRCKHKKEADVLWTCTRMNSNLDWHGRRWSRTMTKRRPPFWTTAKTTVKISMTTFPTMSVPLLVSTFRCSPWTNSIEHWPTLIGCRVNDPFLLLPHHPSAMRSSVCPEAKVATIAIESLRRWNIWNDCIEWIRSRTPSEAKDRSCRLWVRWTCWDKSCCSKWPGESWRKAWIRWRRTPNCSRIWANEVFPTIWTGMRVNWRTNLDGWLNLYIDNCPPLLLRFRYLLTVVSNQNLITWIRIWLEVANSVSTQSLTHTRTLIRSLLNHLLIMRLLMNLFIVALIAFPSSPSSSSSSCLILFFIFITFIAHILLSLYLSSSSPKLTWFIFLPVSTVLVSSLHSTLCVSSFFYFYNLPF